MWVYLLFFAVVALWLIQRKKHFSTLKNQGIPGPEPNIFFGNLIEMMSKTPLKCHKEWIQKYGKVVGYYFGTRPVILIADPEMLKKIQVSNFHKFINRPDILRNNSATKPNKRVEGFSEHLIVLRDKRWKDVRSVITPTFTASKMKQMTPIMNGAIDSLVKKIETMKESGKEFDIYQMYQGLTMDVIGRTSFGIQTNVQNDPNDPFLRTVKVLLSGELKGLFVLFAASFRSLSTLWQNLNRIRLAFKNQGKSPVKELIENVKDIIKMRRTNAQSRRPDLLQLMMDAETDTATATGENLTAEDTKEESKNESSDTSSKTVRRMTDNEILDNSVIFFLAGYETTSTALAFTTHFLVHYPETQEKIREEVKQLLQSGEELDYNSLSKLLYLDMVVKESLRLYPPIYLFVSRECSEDMSFGNIKLRKGDAVQVPTYNLQRDPELWGEDVDKFKPERWLPENKSSIHPMAFQAFGAGPRNCVGMRFALLEAKLAIARILAKYRIVKCSATEGENLTLKISSATINPKNGIWVKAVDA